MYSGQGRSHHPSKILTSQPVTSKLPSYVIASAQTSHFPSGTSHSAHSNGIRLYRSAAPQHRSSAPLLCPFSPAPPPPHAFLNIRSLCNGSTPLSPSIPKLNSAHSPPPPPQCSNFIDSSQINTTTTTNKRDPSAIQIAN